MKNNKNLVKKIMSFHFIFKHVISEIENENVINSYSRRKMALSSEIVNANFSQWSFGIVFKDDN